MQYKKFPKGVEISHLLPEEPRQGKCDVLPEDVDPQGRDPRYKDNPGEDLGRLPPGGSEAPQPGISVVLKRK